jgi:hypothetical protein
MYLMDIKIKIVTDLMNKSRQNAKIKTADKDKGKNKG